jgi:hypothetical protein
MIHELTDNDSSPTFTGKNFLCITLLSEISGISNPLGEEFTTLLLAVNAKLDLSPTILEYRETLNVGKRTRTCFCW